MNIAIACGGTGGHLFPGLATAAVLRARGHDVTLWLTGRASEAVQEWDGRVQVVPARGFSGRAGLGWVGAAFSLGAAWGRSLVAMRRYRPDVLLAMGSYAGVGPALAAKTLGVPLVLHEGNALPGRATTFLVRRATALAVNGPDWRRKLGGVAPVEVGFPLRAELLRAAEPGRARSSGRGSRTLLVMGGSQGAHVLNRAAAGAVCALHGTGTVGRVVHVTGAADEDEARQTYAQAGVPHEVLAFVSEIGPRYRDADLAVCRAGAGTCAELCLFELPALLVPLPDSVGGHQEANADILVRAGAAVLVPEQDLDEQLAATIEGMLADEQKLRAMSVAAATRARPDSAERLADVVEGVVVCA